MEAPAACISGGDECVGVGIQSTVLCTQDIFVSAGLAVWVSDTILGSWRKGSPTVLLDVTWVSVDLIL